MQRLKGLVRQKTTNSMPNPVAMGRAFLAKAHHHSNSNGHKGGTSSNNNVGNGSVAIGSAMNTPTSTRGGVESATTLAEVFGSKDAGLIPNRHRAFLMDTQVKYTVVSTVLQRSLTSLI